MTRIAVVYYSATGNVHRLAHALAEGASDEGAEVRIRHVEETFVAAAIAAAKRMRVESLPAELEERLLEAFRGWRRTRGRPSDSEHASEASPSNEQEN